MSQLLYRAALLTYGYLFLVCRFFMVWLFIGCLFNGCQSTAADTDASNSNTVNSDAADSSAADLDAAKSAQETLPVLKKISFEGNVLLKEGKLITLLALQPTSWIPVFGDTRYFDATVLDQDLTRVVRIYEANGIFGTKVLSHEVSQKNDGKEVSLVIRVKEGIPAKIVTLETQNQPSEVSPELALKLGDTFDEVAYANSKKRIIEALRNAGYPFAKVEGAVSIDALQGKASIVFQVNAGSRYVMGEIEVKGAEAIAPWQIIEASGLKPGILVRDEDLSLAQSRLYETGAFRLVEIRPGQPKPGSNKLPFLLFVAESPFQTFGLGGGVGFATGRQEVRGRLQYRHNNFLGGMRRLELEGRPAYIIVNRNGQNFLESEQKGFGGLASASFFQPDALFDYGLRNLGFNSTLEFERDILDAFFVTTGRTRAGVLWPTLSASQVEAGVNFEAFFLSDLPAEIRQCEKACYLTYWDQRLVWDARDNRTEPRKGVWARLELQESMPPAHTFAYARVSTEGRGYLPLAGDSYLASRLLVGTFFPWKGSQTPIPKRFSAGGSASHRGFGLRRLSPQVATKRSRRAVPIGGNDVIVGNFEMRLPVTEKLTTAVFLDAGNVDNGRQTYEPTNQNLATGLGMRYDTAVVPIRVDVGYRVKSQERFKAEPQFVFHLTFGDAF